MLLNSGRDEIVNHGTPSNHESGTAYHELGLPDPPNHKIG